MDLELARLGLFIAIIIAEHDLAATIFHAHEWVLNFQAPDALSRWIVGAYMTVVAFAVFKASVFYLSAMGRAEVRIARAVTSRYSVKIVKKEKARAA